MSPAPVEHLPYTILSQELTQTLTPDNRFVNVWRVSFKDQNGYVAYVDVPEEKFNPGEVDRMIEDTLDDVQGVHELGEAPHPENATPAEGGPPEAPEG